MPILLRASLSYVLRHPWQLGLALVGVIAGVAVMVAVDLANSSSRAAYFMSMDAVNGSATHQVLGGPGGLDEQVYVELRLAGHLRDIAPVVEGFVTVGNESLQLLGVDIFAERGFRPYASSQPESSGSDDSGENADLAAIRRLLTVPGAILLPAGVAERQGVSAGARLGVIVDGRVRDATLVGTFGGDRQRSLQGLAVVDIAQAQHWLGMQGRLSRIDVKLADGQSVAGLLERLPENVQVLEAAGRTRATAAMSEAFTTNLMAMSLLAMLVGIFLIYNSVAFAVLQRRGLLGVLRALGVTRAQIVGIVLIEAAALGVVGSVLGVLCGIALGDQLVVLVSRAISDHYFVANVTDVAVSGVTLAKGMLAGTVATLLAAAVPAAEAALIRPRLAMLRSVVEQGAHRSLPYLSVAGSGFILLAILLLAVSGKSLVAGLAAVFAVILGVALLIPRFVNVVTAAIEPLARRVGGTGASMATGGIGISLSRTGVAIVALAVAVSATIGVSIMVDSFRQSVGQWLGDTLQSDVYVGVVRGSLDSNVLADIAALPGVLEYSTSRRVWLEDDAGRTRLIALQMAGGSYAGIKLRGDDDEQAWQRFDRQEGVLVSDPLSYKRGVTAGDRIELRTRYGLRDFAVAAVYLSYDSNDGSIIMNRRTYDRYFEDPGVDSAGLYLAPGFSADDVMDEIRALADGRQALIMNSNARIREISLDIFDRTFVITNVIYWLAVGVAVVGILGAMLALQLERAREFGVLRAVGMTPWQLGRLITGQSALMGLLSGIAAVPLGIVMAVLLIEVINRRAFGWQMDIEVSLSGLGVAVMLAVAAATLAGIYPAYRAARARPALAMREE